MTSTKTAQLPYADAFVPYVKYCITWISKDRSKLSCFTGVKFLKNILVKGIVSKAAMKGMQENITIFMPIVKNEANKLTRRKRSGSKEKMDQASLKRTGTIRRPSSKNLDEITSVDKASSSGLSRWYEQAESLFETIRDLVEALPLIVKIGIASVLVIWLLYSWLRSGSKRFSKENVIMHSPVASRAVYLRDINEGLLNVDRTPIYSHSER